MILNEEFLSAKNIVDFYIEKLSQDTMNKEAIFAMQYANLKLLKLRTVSSLNTLESYPIGTA